MQLYDSSNVDGKYGENQTDGQAVSKTNASLTLSPHAERYVCDQAGAKRQHYADAMGKSQDDDQAKACNAAQYGCKFDLRLHVCFPLLGVDVKQTDSFIYSILENVNRLAEMGE